MLLQTFLNTNLQSDASLALLVVRVPSAREEWDEIDHPYKLLEINENQLRLRIWIHWQTMSWRLKRRSQVLFLLEDLASLDENSKNTLYRWMISFVNGHTVRRLGWYRLCSDVNHIRVCLEDKSREIPLRTMDTNVKRFKVGVDATLAKRGS